MDSSPRTVLLADASPLARGMAVAYLAQLGYGLVTAGNGPEAWATLAAMRPPPLVVLADAGLPQWPGFELCRRIKAEPRWQALPVVILLGALADAGAAELAAADGVMRKPLSPEGLQEWLDRVRRAATAPPPMRQ